MREFLVRTSEGVDLRLEIAGAASRLAATLLDLVLITAGLLSLYTLLVLFTLGSDGRPGVGLGLLAGGALLAFPGYFVFFHLRWDGQSPGKRALGLVVASGDGSPATAGQLVLRGILWIVDALLWIPAPMGLLLAAATPRGQRLGDLAAGTVVLRHRSRTEHSSEPWPDESWSTRAKKELDLSPGMAARLTDEDVVFLRDLVARVGVEPDVRSRQLHIAVEHYARRVGFTPGASVRSTLKELYLFAREVRAQR